MGILAELRRRRLFRVAALYVVGAWMVLQVFDLLFPRLGIPDAVMDLAFIGALAGFPVALVFGWIYDITPQGIVRTRPSSGEDDYGDLSLKRSDYLILTALLAVVGAIVYNLAIEVTELPPEGEDLLAPLEAPENSIAVLPFANMSIDPDNDYFCDGITEEILNKLAAMGDLHVIARTSSFALKDSGFDIRKMAALLGVRYLLQGSVRRDGNQLRISTQLLDRDGQQLWNTSFDREMEGIFAIQRDIADSVAVTITPQIVSPADSRHVPDIEAYQHYLRGHEIYIKRLPGYQWSSAEQFRKAIELDPEFAEPYAELATVMTIGARWEDDYQGTFDQAQEAIDTALALNPNLARAHAAQGLMLTMQKSPDYARAKVALRKALDLDPNLVNAHNWLAGVYSALGNLEDSVAQYELATRIDPLAPIINMNLAMGEMDRGKTDQAKQRLLRLLQVPRPSHHPFYGLLEIYQETGRLVDAHKISKQMVLVFARQFGNAWARPLARNYALLGMVQQAEYWYDELEQEFEDNYQVRFARLVLLRRQGLFDEMKEVSDRILDARQMSPSELPPQFALRYGTAMVMAGAYAEGVDILGQTLSLDTPGEGGLGDPGARDPFHTYAWALRATGDSGEAETIISRMEKYLLAKQVQGLMHRSSDQFSFAQNALLAGDEEAALERLQRAIDAGWRDYYLMLHDPRWESLRDNPRFQELIASVKRDIDAQRADVELIDAEDDYRTRLDAAIAEFEARAEDG